MSSLSQYRFVVVSPEIKEVKGEKMNDINFVESAISELLDLKRDSRLNLSLRNQIDDLLSGLQFLQLYARCLAKLQRQNNRHLGAVRNPQIKATLGQATEGLYGTGISALETQDFQDWDNLASDLLQKIQLLKPKIERDCSDLLSRNNLASNLLQRIRLSKSKIEKDSRDLLDSSFLCRFSSFELREFFRNISDTLSDLLLQKFEKVVDIQMHIQKIQEKLSFFTQIFALTREMQISNKVFKDFNVLIQAWAYNAACLSLLHWVRDENHEEILLRMRIFLLTPEVTRMFLAVLKHFWSLSHNRLLMDEGVRKFVDFLLEILQLSPLKDGIQNLHSKLTFLTTFLIDPPMVKGYREDAESIAKEVQSLICSLGADQVEGATAGKRNILLHDFQEKMNTVKAKVSQLYARIFLDMSSFDFPTTNVLGFIDLLIDNVREISLMPNHQVDEMLEEDLLSLRSFLEDILKVSMYLHENLSTRMTRIINVFYRVEIAVNMLPYLNDYIWCDMKLLSDVREEINVINREVTGIQNGERKSHESHGSHVNMSRTDYVVVGFKDDLEIILDQLMGGSRDLGIVSIVGMPGIGKTTLAKMVYNHPSIQYHFNSRAWCCVSQIYQSRNILLDILSGINMLRTNGDSSEMTEDDLAELLLKCLKGSRYLIVMDDVWDIEVWNFLKVLLPNDNNGSRILFTSRIHGLALQTQHSCVPYSLPPLSVDESWKMLQQKLFLDRDSPPTLVEVGKQIARHCNGLPLAIAVTASLLSMRGHNLDSWKQMAESLQWSIATETRVMDILEISYNHLPEFLKSCFLYFGAFQEEKGIRVRRLIQLWISEGFVHKSDGKSLEDVAEEHLIDLVSRSLVVVTNRSSTGGIKECKIHSLVYELCLKKGEEKKFLQVESGNDLFFNSTDAIYKNYRICIQSGGDRFFASNPLGPCVHSLLFVPDHTCLNKGDLFSISNFKLLQILDLEDMEFNCYFPEEVILLILLRYFAIWCPHGILSIPPSIANLRNLETFRVKRDATFEDEICFPHTMWKMKRLRHVHVGAFTASFSGDREPDEESLTLDNIQTFSAPSLSYGGDAEKLLRRLPRVRKLKCRFNDSCDPYQQQNHFPNLDILSELESLYVKYEGSLFYPCAFNFPCRLKKLTLAQFKLPWSMSKSIGYLPHLEVLKLLKDAFDGEEWDVQEYDFQNLKFLKLCELNIAQLNASNFAFPRLEQLIVENCDELEEIPLTFGDVPTLRKIQVRCCKPKVASSVMAIQELQHEYGIDDLEVCVN